MGEVGAFLHLSPWPFPLCTGPVPTRVGPAHNGRPAQIAVPLLARDLGQVEGPKLRMSDREGRYTW